MKYIIGIVSIIGIILILLFCPLTTSTNSEYLRIHIRANSNSDIDQSVKYEIKDAVVDALIPILSTCTTKDEASTALKNNFEYIESIADNILEKNNFNYKSNAKLSYEEFPTRTYGELTLEAGFYDALILELGEAKGDNWWCVVYPPLCFVNGSTHVNGFKSRIMEIINNFFK